MRRQENIWINTDWLTVFIYLALVVFGWMNIYSVNYSESDPVFFSKSNRYAMQLGWIIVSFILIVIVFLIDSRFYSFIAYPTYIFSMIVLLAVIVIGREVHGSKSWIMIGPIALQPAEFAKPATALALAKFMSGFNVKSQTTENILKSLGIIFLPPILIMLQPDFGSTLVYAALLIVLYREGLPGWIIVLLMFLAALFLGALILSKLTILVILIGVSTIGYIIWSKNIKNGLFSLLIISMFIGTGLALRYFNIISFSNYLILFISLALTTLVVLIVAISSKIKGVFQVILLMFVMIGFVYSVDFVFHNVLKKHQQERIQIMLGLKSDPWGYEYNVNQSKIAIGSGGLTGRGYMKGPQTKLKYVPEQSTDFIFCTVGEEWGFLGSSILVILFCGLIIRLIIIAERQRSRFSRIFGYGVVAIIFFHFAVNIAMTIALFPVIGIPLPFLSYGGSSLMSFTVLLFILLRLDSTRKSYLI